MKFEFTLTFSEQYLATLAVQRRSPIQLIAASIFPLMGATLAFVILIVARRSPTIYESGVIALTLAFTPAMTAFGVWLYRRKNRTVQGSHTITFEDDGVRVVAPVFETMLRYPGIRRVVETKRFILLFFSPQGAQYIPKRVMAVGELERLRELLRDKVKP